MEISSVNHRYQEIAARLPREFSSYEPALHQKLRNLFRRGKVQLRLDVLWAREFRLGNLNKDALLAYCDELMEVRRSLALPLNVDVERLASLPGVFDVPRFGEDETRDVEKILDELLASAVKNWQKMRDAEGVHLRDEILRHLLEFEALVAKIEAAWQTARDGAFSAMRKRVEEALAKSECALEEPRYIQEIVLAADKWDVAEELARLKSHIAKFRAAGEESESAGRKLDFLVQEMNREVNTLDSKVADADIRWLAVEAKSSLEKIREQIQNLE